MKASVWLSFWDSSLYLFLSDPFKVMVGLLALSETPGASGGVSLQQHQATSPKAAAGMRYTPVTSPGP